MKKLVWFIVGLLCMTFSRNSYAQNDASAKALLAKVSQKYNTYKTIQANFSLDIKQANGSSHADGGTIYLDKSNNKYHVSTKNQVLISDSKTQWNIMKAEKEVEVSETSNSTNEINPTNIFSFYTTGFKYAMANTEKAKGLTLSVVELSPVDSKKNYSKIKLRINKANNLIYDTTIIDKSGNRYIYTLGSQEGNKALSANLFTFNKNDYKGFDIVDLR
ncbi:MAG: outer membrane lipoprotein carrier protein LolA [Sphingobacterium sp.]|jgi:outer membrane lipoprotein-sorting protein|uniref:LolA family protein n=1 Tax=Sphingobacterium sp. TaxID=341027 RepID=UPI0028283DC3|nr:outer membrane lipoprotein carrier protein LolA [Sphingobacterium sp.]MDR0263628.1 outer membrane lipoprotein carrier protein LolA [Sphingobacterium sp.]